MLDFVMTQWLGCAWRVRKVLDIPGFEPGPPAYVRGLLKHGVLTTTPHARYYRLPIHQEVHHQQTTYDYCIAAPMLQCHLKICHVEALCQGADVHFRVK